MAPISFSVIEHVIPGQHIREYPNATKLREEDVLQISIKQYVPLNRSTPVPDNAVTIIGAHGNGFPKETYEPFWADLCSNLQSRNVEIRGIWIADTSNQGASGILNEQLQGDSTSWFDHSRDLLHMITHFRGAIPRPIIGVAHSMGCVQLVQLSIMHPRLLSTLVLCEPVMMDEHVEGPNPALGSTLRREIWDNRVKAETALRKVFKTWDQRALEKYLQYGLRNTPTALFDPSLDKTLSPESVTLATSKHQEAWAYAQVNFNPPDARLNRLLLPDWDSKVELPHLTSRPECFAAIRNLPYVRPSVLYIFGGKSPLSPRHLQDRKVNATGIGTGGSGGVAEGMVEKRVFPTSGHLLVFEDPGAPAEATADWIQRWHARWGADEQRIRSYKNPKSDESMLRMSRAWVEAVKRPANAPRPSSTKL